MFEVDLERSTKGALDVRNEWEREDKRKSFVENPRSWEAIIPFCNFDFKTRRRPIYSCGL